jgi:Arc/MetJ-type ribon-helix-helix transcriptional regulator
LAAIRAARPLLDKALKILAKDQPAAAQPPAENPALVLPRPGTAGEDKPVIPKRVSAEELIRQAIRQLRGEYGRIMVVGRAHTPAEKARMEALQAAMGHLNKALAVLQQGVVVELLPLRPPRRPPSPSDLIRKAIKELASEATMIQVQGRALTPEEVGRLEAIKKATVHLQKAVGVLDGGDDESPPDRPRR